MPCLGCTPDGAVVGPNFYWLRLELVTRRKPLVEVVDEFGKLRSRPPSLNGRCSVG
ncbi:hypothetical protein BCAR13_1870001 [Paraburkholderia caribensis]|nr:hypothetical protein BCAR13_1870001 [Paraburkholderia caribensis]